MRKLAMALAALSVIFAACQKNEIKNDGITEYGVAFEALNPSFSLPVGTTKSVAVSSDSITWDSAHLVVSVIKFEAKLLSQLSGKDSIEIEYTWHGPELVNLLNNDLSLGNFVLQPGTYDEIELKVAGKKEDAGETPVFYLKGSYVNNSGTWPIVVEVNENVAFKTEKENVEVTDEGIDITSVIQLYLDQLMTDIDPAALDSADLTDGVIVISADSNTALYHAIADNLSHDRHTHYKHKGDDNDDDGHENQNHQGGDH